VALNSFFFGDKIVSQLYFNKKIFRKNLGRQSEINCCIKGCQCSCGVRHKFYQNWTTRTKVI